MTHFNLNDLRADAADHSDWFIYGFGDHDAMIDFIIGALIGYDSYILLHSSDSATICFRADGKTHISMYHSL